LERHFDDGEILTRQDGRRRIDDHGSVDTRILRRVRRRLAIV
jgi:hypothetical protein